MTILAAVVVAAVLFGVFALVRPTDRKVGCTGDCAGCTGDGECASRTTEGGQR
jgi:hypothetical protein